MTLALYRKYRPAGFGEVVGQEHVVRTLRNAIKREKVSHAYLFSGPRGTGKTSIARILAKAVNCLDLKDGEPCNKCANCADINSAQFLDLVEIDAATHTQVDKMRDIIERINFSPSRGKKKVYIIDEVHMLSKGAFNALLKTLEEPPAHVLFVLATTEIHKIPATIISRCQRFDFRHLRIEEIKERLSEIAETEKVEVEDGVLEFVALSSGGGMRDSESLFGQIIALQDDNKITLKEVQDILSLPDASLALDIIKLILESRYGEAVSSIDKIAEGGYDLFELNKGIVECLRKLMLLKLSPSIKESFSSQMTSEQIKELEDISVQAHLPKIFRIIGAFVKSQASIKGAILPQLPLELAIAEIKIAEDGGLTSEPNPAYNSKASLKNSDSSASSAKEKEEKREEPSLEETKAKREMEFEKAEENNGERELDSQEILQDGETEDSAPKEAPYENSADFRKVKDEWSEIVNDVRKCNNSLTACLKTCQPIMMENGQVVVACQYSFHKDKLQKLENRAAVEQIASEIVQSPVLLRFISKEEAQKLGFEMEEVEMEEKHTENLVNSALDMFGGEVVA